MSKTTKGTRSNLVRLLLSVSRNLQRSVRFADKFDKNPFYHSRATAFTWWRRRMTRKIQNRRIPRARAFYFTPFS